MKIIALTAAVVAFSLAGAPVEARDRGYSKHGHNYHSSRHHSYSRHHSRRHHYGYRHHSSKGGYLLGGLIIGGLINHAYHNSTSHHPSTVVHTRVVKSPQTVVHHTYEYEDEGKQHTQQASDEITLRVLKDEEGRCFAITHNEDGKEALKEIDRSICEG